MSPRQVAVIIKLVLIKLVMVKIRQFLCLLF